MTWAVVIPGSPGAINRAYRVVEFGPRCPHCGRGKPGMAKNEGVETWQTEVAYRTRAARPSGWQPERRVIIEIEFWMAKAGRDADGPLKPLLDGVAVGLGVNDKIFLPRVMLNEVDRVSPRTIVRIDNAADTA